MPYCLASDVRIIINTALTDPQITTIIETSDAYIDKLLGAQSTSDKLIKRLSMLLTAKAIKTRDPQSQSIGEYSESQGGILQVWDGEIREIMAIYRHSLRRV